LTQEPNTGMKRSGVLTFKMDQRQGYSHQYVPKGSDIRTLTAKQIKDIMDRLNNRPRKSLGFLTPNEVFYERKQLTG